MKISLVKLTLPVENNNPKAKVGNMQLHLDAFVGHKIVEFLMRRNYVYIKINCEKENAYKVWQYVLQQQNADLVYLYWTLVLPHRHQPCYQPCSLNAALQVLLYNQSSERPARLVRSEGLKLWRKHLDQ